MGWVDACVQGSRSRRQCSWLTTLTPSEGFAQVYNESSRSFLWSITQYVTRRSSQMGVICALLTTFPLLYYNLFIENLNKINDMLVDDNSFVSFREGSPVTRWASVAFGAGIGLGSAYSECSQKFDTPVAKVGIVTFDNRLLLIT
ncbi:hypothetical protein CTI12_AA511750 [Artemisia annua]|uniref:Uncharacterized protein n=1 Tax=Artemisia annua TaxID=35608 RepID=A0A2U1LAV8_ARTAN|nr:hypothetical protein CTI12_AA511750 [Artemisia annua]